MDKLTLPVEDHVPESAGMPKDLLIFGPPKCGKTTLGASFPNSLVLECEPGGAKYIKCRKLDITSLEQLREAWNLLKEDTTYETIVIDSLDRVAMWIEEEICQQMGIKNIMEAKKGERNGAQWGFYADNVLTFIQGWKALGKRVIFLAHTKKTETDGNGLVINPKTINLYGQAASRVTALVENIGHLYATENSKGEIIRVLSFRAGMNVEAGSRHPLLTDKQIELPKENPYSAFEALFTVHSNGKKDSKLEKELAKASR